MNGSRFGWLWRAPAQKAGQQERSDERGKTKVDTHDGSQCNDRASLKKVINGMIIGSYLMLAACVAAVALVVGGLWWWLG